MSILPPEMLPRPGTIINSLSVLAKHPPLAAADLGMSRYLRFESTLDPRTFELLILRTAWLHGAEYELLRHARKAKREGWTDEELARISIGSSAEGWKPTEVQLLRAVEEIDRDGCVSDDTWAGLADQFSEQQLLDILFTVGVYTLHAIVFASIGLQPEEDLPPYPGFDSVSPPSRP
jgi:4-carboxymuconolactone decarboxylase